MAYATAAAAVAGGTLVTLKATWIAKSKSEMICATVDGRESDNANVAAL